MKFVEHVWKATQYEVCWTCVKATQYKVCRTCVKSHPVWSLLNMCENLPNMKFLEHVWKVSFSYNVLHITKNINTRAYSFTIQKITWSLNIYYSINDVIIFPLPYIWPSLSESHQQSGDFTYYIMKKNLTNWCPLFTISKPWSIGLERMPVVWFPYLWHNRCQKFPSYGVMWVHRHTFHKESF